MSHSHPKLNQTQRKLFIREHVGNKTLNEIAELCGVDRRTIYRDIDKLKDNGLWFRWIEERFLEVLAAEDISNSKKLVALGILYGKQFTEKHQIEATGEISYVIKKWNIHDADGEEDIS